MRISILFQKLEKTIDKKHRLHYIGKNAILKKG